jgi:hypothetical protein
LDVLCSPRGGGKQEAEREACQENLMGLPEYRNIGTLRQRILLNMQEI